MVYAVIFAGGVGHRMAKDTPKQFLTIKDKPILIHTIEKFDSCPVVDNIVVVVLQEYLSYTDDLIKKYRFRKVSCVIAGGSTAINSQFLGLSKIHDTHTIDDNDIVLIHDGVRPFITNSLIEGCVETVKKHGSAITVSLASETIGVINKEKQIQYTLPRQNCYLARAPQCFYFKDIYGAHLKAKNEGKDFIDSASMMLSQGCSLYPIIGPNDNIKITNQYDYALAKLLLGDHA